MKRLFIFLALLLSADVESTPTNNTVIPPVVSIGYGVDWMFRSLRIGIGWRDSLLEDGWVVADSSYISYISGDRGLFSIGINAETFACDSLSFTIGDSVSSPATQMEITSYSWMTNVVYDSCLVANASIDMIILTDLPINTQITRIFIVVTDGFSGESIGGITVQAGYNVDIDNLLAATSCAVTGTIIGDDGGEVAYTAVQGGIVPSYIATSTIMIKLIAVGNNLDALTTGALTIYIDFKTR